MLSKVKSLRYWNNKKAKVITLLSLASVSAFCLLLINHGRFMSISELVNVWGSSFYTNTIKMSFFAFLISAIATGFSSASIQNLNGNYIATSSTLGIGASASFGYILCSYINVYDYWVKILMMTGAAILPVFLNFFIIRMKKGSKNNVILVGLAITAVFGALSYIIRDKIGMENGQLLFMNTMSEQLSWEKFYYAVPMLIIGLVLLIINFKKINIINYSKEIADKQNIKFNNVYLVSSIGNLLVIISMVFLIGEITFLGIIGTNLVRMFLKTDSTLTLAITSSMFNVIIIFIAELVHCYLNIDVYLTVVITAVPIFMYLIFGRKEYD